MKDDVMHWSDEDAYQEIYEAIVFDNDDEMALNLLEKYYNEGKVNINQTDEEGLTFLHHAETVCLEETVQFLKDNGAV
jgi:ankyrin repeat protein